ncbi:putative Obstructor-G, partial [Daphnia magna]
LLQAETVIAAARSRQVSLLSKGLRLYGDSRGAGDIEIGPDPTFICPPNTPVAPHPEKCELYYTCYPGYPVTLWQCYSDYLFDLTYSGCNYPIEVDCGVRNRPVTNAPTTVTTPKTTTAPSSNTVPPNQPTFNCPTPDGFFAIPNTCTGDYYVCVSGSPYVSTCPNGNIFDPATKICTPPANATCTKPVFTCPTPDGFFPIPGACSNSYYVCVGNVPHIQVT